MKNKKRIYFIGIMILIIIIGSMVYASNSSTNPIQTQVSDKKTTKKVYEHTFPEQITKKDFLKGEFVLNDVASIYPRREALVKDILFDIGDEVKVGDTLAILFEAGVSGEADSKINLKNTQVSTKNKLLGDFKNVKEAKIAETDAKIAEKEIIIKETIKNYDIKILQLENLIKNKNSSEDSSVISFESQVSVEEKNLELLQKNLENALSTNDEKLYESENNIKQKEDLLNSKIEEYFYNIIPIFYLGKNSFIDYEMINTYDISEYLGAKNISYRNDLLGKAIIFQTSRDTLKTIDKYKNLIEINNLLIKVLKNTIISVNITESTISNYISTINSYNSMLLSQKENYDDARNTHNILIRSEDEKIQNLEKQIIKQEEIINMKKSSLLVVNTGKTEKIENLDFELDKLKLEKSLQIEKLKAELKTLISGKSLLIANEDKGITGMLSEIQVAKADLNREFVSSGDYKIISPFSGVISKRSLKIGEKISPSMEAFRITGVENSLSKITKKEVKFYVPENLKNNLSLNKEISFSLLDNENTSFTGTIYRISPEIDEKTFSIIVQAKVDENVLLPNKSTLKVNLETKESIYKIPSKSIYNKSDKKIMYYKKDNGKLGIKEINIISDDGEYTLITGDFDDTLKVVTTPIFIK
ncbi:MAG: HlyD family efflux transporter periplasmic adaptor subunit [Candidatus Gracilibacteria bacterium]|nr:HlyD family efflux transporter periplasmic adaptor subunit [Candidatus Gracilibacteria bacterium]